MRDMEKEKIEEKNNLEKEDFSKETKEVFSKVFFFAVIVLVIWLVLFNSPEKEFEPLSLSEDIIKLSEDFFLDNIADENIEYQFSEHSIGFEETEFGKYTFENDSIVTDLSTSEEKDYQTIWNYSVQFDSLNLRNAYYDNEEIVYNEADEE